MKKFVFPIFIGLLIGGIVSGGYLWWIRNQSVPVEQTAVATPTPAPLLVWNDPNGFTFQYPEGLSVNIHDEDKENYAHLEFTHPDHPGNLIVWGKDLPKGVTDAAGWVKNEKRFTGASVLDTQLGGQKAAKIMIEGVTRTVVSGAVNDSILWSVEAKLEDAKFWTGVHTTITDSFTFVSVKEPGSEATTEPAPVVETQSVDEEEVVE